MESFPARELASRLKSFDPKVKREPDWRTSADREVYFRGRPRIESAQRPT